MALLVLGSIAAIGGYMLFWMKEPTASYDYDAYFASNKNKLVIPEPVSIGESLVDTIGVMISNNFLVKNGISFFKSVGRWVTNKTGEFAGDVITGWLTEFFSSPTTIMVLIAVALGLIVAGYLIHKL